MLHTTTAAAGGRALGSAGVERDPWDDDPWGAEETRPSWSKVWVHGVKSRDYAVLGLDLGRGPSLPRP